MARRSNYGFEKHRKEKDKKAKKDAKREERQRRRSEGTPAEPEPLSTPAGNGGPAPPAE